MQEWYNYATSLSMTCKDIMSVWPVPVEFCQRQLMELVLEIIMISWMLDLLIVFKSARNSVWILTAVKLTPGGIIQLHSLTPASFIEAVRIKVNVTDVLVEGSIVSSLGQINV
jgi:hypothetical protein